MADKYPMSSFSVQPPVEHDAVLISSTTHNTAGDTDTIETHNVKIHTSNKKQLGRKSNNELVLDDADDGTLNESPSSFLTSIKQIVSQVSTSIARNLQGDVVENEAELTRSPVSVMKFKRSSTKSSLGELDEEKQIHNNDQLVDALVETTTSTPSKSRSRILRDVDDATDSKFALNDDDYDEKYAESLRESIREQNAIQSGVSPYMSMMSQIDEINEESSSSTAAQGVGSRTSFSAEQQQSQQQRQNMLSESGSLRSLTNSERNSSTNQQQQERHSKRAPSIFSMPIVPVSQTSSGRSSTVTFANNRKRNSSTKPNGNSANNSSTSVDRDDSATPTRSRAGETKEFSLKSLQNSLANNNATRRGVANNEASENNMADQMDETERRMMATVDSSRQQQQQDWPAENSLALQHGTADSARPSHLGSKKYDDY